MNGNMSNMLRYLQYVRYVRYAPGVRYRPPIHGKSAWIHTSSGRGFVVDMAEYGDTLGKFEFPGRSPGSRGERSVSDFMSEWGPTGVLSVRVFTRACSRVFGDAWLIQGKAQQGWEVVTHPGGTPHDLSRLQADFHPPSQTRVASVRLCPGLDKCPSARTSLRVSSHACV